MRKRQISLAIVASVLTCSGIGGCRSTTGTRSPVSLSGNQVSAALPSSVAFAGSTNDTSPELIALKSSAAKVDEAASTTASYSPEEYAAAELAQRGSGTRRTSSSSSCSAGCCP